VNKENTYKAGQRRAREQGKRGRGEKLRVIKKFGAFGTKKKVKKY